VAVISAITVPDWGPKSFVPVCAVQTFSCSIVSEAEGVNERVRIPEQTPSAPIRS